MRAPLSFSLFFFFNDTATTEIYTLSLHDALPISSGSRRVRASRAAALKSNPRTRSALAISNPGQASGRGGNAERRSEEHTSELQSQSNLVCRLLLEKKKNKNTNTNAPIANTAQDI